MIEHMTWNGGPLDPLLYLLGEQQTSGSRNKVKIIRSLDWMLRIVDVAGALAARGYPPGLSAELHLDLSDDILPANAGRWVLSVDGGRGQAQPGGAGRLRLDARDLAAIYAAQPLPPLPLRYVDWAFWQRRALATTVLDEQLAFWRRELASVPALELPTDRPRPPVLDRGRASRRRCINRRRALQRDLAARCDLVVVAD